MTHLWALSVICRVGNETLFILAVSFFVSIPSPGYIHIIQPKNFDGNKFWLKKIIVGVDLTAGLVALKVFRKPTQPSVAQYIIA